MPIPTPQPGEDRSGFLSRCMADSTMRREFTDRDQRMAVCQRQLSAAEKLGEQAERVLGRDDG